VGWYFLSFPTCVDYLTDLVRTYTVQILVEAVHDEMRDMLAVLLSTNLITIKRCLVMVIDK